jgi:hypothetical protein
MTDDMCPGDAEMLQQGTAVGRLPREAHWTDDMTAAGTPRSVVMHEAIAAREDSFLEEWREPIGEDTRMDEQHRFPVAAKFVFQFNVAECRSIHLESSLCPRWTTDLTSVA